MEQIDVLYLAGERVPAGKYQQVGRRRLIHLEVEDHLPGSLDGRVACYQKVHPTWGQLTEVNQPATT